MNFCPKCKSELEWLAGSSGHPNNQYCTNQILCGWKAWERDDETKPKEGTIMEGIDLDKTPTELREEIKADKVIKTSLEMAAEAGLKIPFPKREPARTSTSDGSSAEYYKLPPRCKQLQDLISHKDMNAQMGEIFRATYRYGGAGHSSEMRDIKKILFYAKAELTRLKKLEAQAQQLEELL